MGTKSRSKVTWVKGTKLAFQFTLLLQQLGSLQNQPDQEREKFHYSLLFWGQVLYNCLIFYSPARFFIFKYLLIYLILTVSGLSWSTWDFWCIMQDFLLLAHRPLGCSAQAEPLQSTWVVSSPSRNQTGIPCIAR